MTRAMKKTYTGLFLISLATLMQEILLTRIFSVTVGYHFAFMAISAAMVGLAGGPLLVCLFPGYFNKERVYDRLAMSALFFSILVVASFLEYLVTPLVGHPSIGGLYARVKLYAGISVPFVFAGICTCLVFTHFPQRVGKLYAANLAGAAAGCLALIGVFAWTDGPTAVIVVAFLGSLAAALFAAQGRTQLWWFLALVASLLLGSFVLFHTRLVNEQKPWLRLMWVKGNLESSRPLYEKWNFFSRITVKGNPYKLGKPFAWGLSPAYSPDFQEARLNLNIDSGAGTPLTAFDGDLGRLEYLKYDIVNFAYHLRSDAEVLVIGAGGGRDILACLVFGQKFVTGIEINPDILKIVNQRFGDFTGHLDRHPKVSFINDEARSHLTRVKKEFDVIQISLIDTWAATAAGAYALTENCLYTVEAWTLFLKRLRPGGLLTCSRWYANFPAEIYRLTSLANASLQRMGIRDPRGHILILKNPAAPGAISVGTILVSKDAFSGQDLAVIETMAKKLRFEIMLSPRYAANPEFAALASATGLSEAVKTLPLNLRPPTDDSPFFFHMTRFRDLFKRSSLYHRSQELTLGVLMTGSAALTLLAIGVPLGLAGRNPAFQGSWPWVLFFAFIGCGFMFIELSLIQRLAIFLGHPVYGLSVVLFSLLLSGSIGSYMTQKTERRGALVLSLLPGLLLIAGGLLPRILNLFEGSAPWIRIFISGGILIPIGFLMGFYFPSGMRMAGRKFGSLTPWFWGINGAASVCGSVFATAMALSQGISASFWTGFVCYLIAVMIFFKFAGFKQSC